MGRNLGTRPSRVRRGAWTLGIVVAVAAAVAVVAGVDTGALGRAWRAAVSRPGTAVVAVAAYGAAFVVRAWAWRRLLPGLSFGHALAGIHLALGGNHVLPLRLGEPLRVTSVVRRAGVSVRSAAASTVALRAGDVAALGLLALVLGPRLAWRVAGPVAPVLAVAGLLVAVAVVWWWRRGGQRRVPARPGAGVVAATLAAWVLESAIVWQAADWAGVGLTPAEAVLVTVLTVAAQLAAVAPGGFGTYEAAGTAALVALGVDAGTGLAVVLTAHALKTAYAVVAGAVAAVTPAPSLLGRLRLPPRAAAAPTPAPTTEPHTPVVLLLPAHDEAGTIGDVVARAPAQVGGHPVEVLVVDDGSRDGTATAAAAAGATVVAHDANRGLGAAVRTGLAAAVERGAVATAFCDADGEYAPEELERLVGPVLDGTADYVVGSRFAGDIQRMLPHRRLGNVVLTRLLAFVARAPITDGQSGYRALSARAAAAAEIAHDFNYAQVLTLDLLAKGFTYHEVPISYRFRTQGRSFVRLGRYLRAVGPAAWRVLNREPVDEPA